MFVEQKVVRLFVGVFFKRSNCFVKYLKISYLGIFVAFDDRGGMIFTCMPIGVVSFFVS